MATRTDAPATITQDQWTLGAGASKLAALAANDGDTSYVYTAAGTTKDDRYLFPILAAKSPVTSCTLGAVVRSTGTPTSGNFLIWDGITWQNFGIGTSYAAKTCAFYSLSVEALNTVAPGIYAGGINVDARVTQFYRTTVYDLAACFIRTKVMSVLLPLIGSAIGLSHLPGLSREFTRLHTLAHRGRSRLELSEAEMRQWLRELHAWRRPRFVFLGA
jgi:hypothetical protein